MLFIVTYHFLRDIVENNPDTAGIELKAIWLPLHIAVICFLLISGYFHIKPSVMGGGKLLLPVIFYYAIPCFIARCCGITDYIGGGQQAVFFLTKSPYWFIRAYFCLFLIAPILNQFLDSATCKTKLYLLLALAFTSIYGAMMGDEAYVDGKNLVLFMTIYVLGDILNKESISLHNIKTYWIVLLWILLNIVIVISYVHYCETSVGECLWELSYPYSSPLLIVNATLFFLLFSRFNITSKLINTAATSVFAVYILTEHSLIKPLLLKPVYEWIYHTFESNFSIIAITMFFAFIVMVFAILIDKLLLPVYQSGLNMIKRLARE